MSNDISVPSNVFELVKAQESMFSSALTTDVISWQKESQFAIQHLQKNDFLAKTAWANQASLQNAIINVAAIGISLNPANKHAYLVPRDKMVCLDVSYMGLVHLAVSSGAIEWCQAKLVHENDDYINNGIDKAPTHRQKTFGDKGPIVGAYCTVKLPNGDYLTEEMDISALNKVKESSKAANGPWKNWPEEMMRKTVVKRAAKHWPSTEGVNRLNQAISVINEHEGLAEEVEPYTEEDKQELDMLIKAEDGFSLAAFICQFDEECQTALHNSFPKGQISSNKKIWRQLVSSGHSQWDSFAADVKDMIERSDKDGLIESLDGFKPYEKKHLAKIIGNSYTSTLKELISQ